MTLAEAAAVLKATYADRAPLLKEIADLRAENERLRAELLKPTSPRRPLPPR